jgi:hypothetical protein
MAWFWGVRVGKVSKIFAPVEGAHIVLGKSGVFEVCAEGAHIIGATDLLLEAEGRVLEVEW